MAYRYDGSGDSFSFSLETIRQSLRHRSLTDCRLFLDHLTTISTMIVDHSGNDCLIKYDKITKIKDNHHKNLPVGGNKNAKDLPLDKIRIDKKRIDKNIKEKSNDDVDKQNLDKDTIKQNKPSSISPLEILSFSDPELITWIRKGTFAIQEKLLKKYDYDYLSEVTQKAFYWQLENKKRQAGTFLSSWIDRDNNKKLKGNLSEADFNLKAFFQEAEAKIIPYDYSIN